jgi:hypothetical protein
LQDLFMLRRTARVVPPDLWLKCAVLCQVLCQIKAKIFRER